MTAVCGGGHLRFRFWLRSDERNDTGCGLPGFALKCDENRSQLVLDLPRSGKFAVQHINYTNRTISINEPCSCLAKRLFDGFDMSGSPLAAVTYNNFTFLSCTSRHVTWHVPTTCMSRLRDGVVVIATISQELVDEVTQSLLWCRRITNVMVPLQKLSTVSGQVDDPQASDLTGDILLTWYTKKCQNRIRARGRAPPPDDTDLSNSIGPQSATISMGLDGPTIESHRVTRFGESGRPPKPDDTTCPICLREYGRKETLRSMLDWNRYFHVNCIDEWLRQNFTCPVCRKSLYDS